MTQASPTEPGRTYIDEALAADLLLDELLGNIRRDADNAEISPAEAAAERIKVMEEHLERIRALRAEHFGGEGAMA